MNPKEMSGLALLEAMRDEKIPAPSISETMSMQPAVIKSGHVEFKVKADHRHLNPLGGVHGGFAATVLDTVQAARFILYLKQVSVMAPLI